MKNHFSINIITCPCIFISKYNQTYRTHTYCYYCLGLTLYYYWLTRLTKLTPYWCCHRPAYTFMHQPPLAKLKSKIIILSHNFLTYVLWSETRHKLLFLDYESCNQISANYSTLYRCSKFIWNSSIFHHPIQAN